MGSEHYCLRWNNHQSNLLGVFSQLLRDESLVDVTLACSEGHSIRAHKVVLSACSSYFQTLFIDHPSRHPIVILKDVRFSELRTLIEFMYKGEVNVEYCQLSALLKTAESLKVKGLAEMTNLDPPRGYKHDPEPEQIEPTELVNRRTEERREHVPTPPEMTSRSPEPRSSPADPTRAPTPLEEEDCKPSDMSMHNNNTTTTTTTTTPCNRLSSPMRNEPLPGPSNMPPVQQVPLVSTMFFHFTPLFTSRCSSLPWVLAIPLLHLVILITSTFPHFFFSLPFYFFSCVTYSLKCVSI